MKKEFAIAAKGVIIKNNTVLLLHRSKKEIQTNIVNKSSPWDLPGGRIQFFENTQKALHREIKEETSLTVEIKDIIDFYDAVKYNIHIGIITYVCEYKQGNVILSDEHDGYYWLTYKELKDSKLPDWIKKHFFKSLFQI